MASGILDRRSVRAMAEIPSYKGRIPWVMDSADTETEMSCTQADVRDVLQFSHYDTASYVSATTTQYVLA